MMRNYGLKPAPWLYQDSPHKSEDKEIGAICFVVMVILSPLLFFSAIAWLLVQFL